MAYIKKGEEEKQRKGTITAFPIRVCLYTLFGFSPQANFICRRLSCFGIPCSSSRSSTTISESSPALSMFFTTAASPPIMFAEPGKINEVVTPPEAIMAVAGS